MLAAMFSGKFETKPSEDGAFFIDRDGTHFRFILNYLRNLLMKLSSTRSKELWMTWSLKHRRSLKNHWFWQMKSTKGSLLIGCLNTVIGINFSEQLEMASQLKLFTPNVIAKDPRLQLWKVETIFLEASRKTYGTVSNTFEGLSR